MKKHLLFTTLAFAGLAIFTACKKDLPIEEVLEPFDQEAMLDHWAKNILIPAHIAYNNSVQTLETQTQAFVNNPTLVSFETAKKAWLESSIAWQQVPSIIKANDWGFKQSGEQDILVNTLYNNTNLYPADIDRIKQRISFQDFDPNYQYRHTQGLAAVEFMLYGLADTDAEVLAFYQQNDQNSTKHKGFLLFLTERLQSQSDAFFNGFSDRFSLRDTSQLDSARPNAIIRDYVNYYREEIQYKKVGDPIGYFYDHYSSKSKTTVEAPFSKVYSKKLLLEALNASQNFYNGVPFGASFENRSNSLYQYLNHLGTQKDGVKLCDLINNEFDKARTEITQLGNNLDSEVTINTKQLINVFEQLNQLNHLLYFDMLSAMEI